MPDDLDTVRKLALSHEHGYEVDLLELLADDAAKWAAAFCAIAGRHGHNIDESWMTTWFSAAIEHSHQVRSRQMGRTGLH